jgi:tryptophan synthase alpha chain
LSKMLVSYLTLGYPNREQFLTLLKGLVDAGSDVLEIGPPPKYAKYDGPVIRRSFKQVSSQGYDMWALLREARDAVSVPIVILTYLEEWIPTLEDFLIKLKDIGINGVLFPDLLIDFIDEYEEYVEAVRTHGLKSVIFTSPSVPDPLIQRASKLSDMFLYYGVRPTTGIAIPITVESLITRVRTLVENKLVVGFGLSDVEDMRRALKAGADGVAIGTAYIEEIERGGVKSAIALARKFRGVLDGS